MHKPSFNIIPPFGWNYEYTPSVKLWGYKRMHARVTVTSVFRAIIFIMEADLYKSRPYMRN
jgi:hypothetical protein